MSDLKHTPGPWKWEGLDGPPVFFGEEVDFYELNGPERTDKAIVETDTNYYGPNGADALLIQAAPDLLEKCKSAYAFIGASRRASPSIANYENVLGMLKKVIWQAEGLENREKEGGKNERSKAIQ